MLLRHPFAPRDAVRSVTPHRLPALLADVVVLLGTLALFALIARVGADAFVRFVPPHEVPNVSLDPRYLPYYAVRSTIRMFLALGASLLFSLLYGYIAATSRRAERVLIPLLDVLQSVPVLGFLSITVTGFIALFPGSLLGLELASIFAIFTSQAWNMTLQQLYVLAVVKNGDQVVIGANPNVAMVFQSFALLPWATVQENVELGLKARGVPRAARAAQALTAIDMVGLDGFESAYPKELSGGMQQRVGFARAFVMEPHVLFMDEPFSALDVLTAENLRGELGMLWEAGTFPAKSILIVTHNIEEAVWLADRVIILSANPGQVRGEVSIDLLRPRERNSAKYKSLVDYIYTAMTHPEAEVAPVPTSRTVDMPPRFPPLPHARAGGISGLLELVVDRGGKRIFRV